MTGGHLAFEGVSKSFPGVRALERVGFEARAGQVHAILGENGAGKSTLLKILSGVYRPDAGRLRIGGAAREFRSTADALRSGVAVIHQELNLVPQLSVAENLFLGHLPGAFGWVDRRQLLVEARRRMLELGEDVDPRTPAGRLPIGQRQMLEIAKALARDARILAFDEPTSSLSRRETERLFAAIRRLRQQGHVLLYVSHRLDEIFEICDAATVLRDGRHVHTFESLAGVSRGALVECMVGRTIDELYEYVPRPLAEPVLEARGLLGPGLRAPASFEVARGEVVGFFGLIGAGRSELLKLLFGAARAQAGRIRVGGRPVAIRNPRTAIAAGVMLCPEDRKKEGILPMRSVMENLNLAARRHFSALGWFIHPRRERANARLHVERLAIRTPSLAQPIRNLSGGNQQKVILARWLSETVRVLLLDEPTRGIDVGAKREIYRIIHELAQRGIGVVVASSDLPEVLGICDRIVVMRQGAIVAALPRDAATPQQVLSLALPAGEAVA